VCGVCVCERETERKRGGFQVDVLVRKKRKVIFFLVQVLQFKFSKIALTDTGIHTYKHSRTC
jgi:hypothetical protein